MLRPALPSPGVLIAPLKFAASVVAAPPTPPTTPARLTYHCTTPDEAAARGLELRDPPEAGWSRQA